MPPVDWSGIATLVGAIGGFLTVLVNVFITFMNWRDQREHKEMLCNISKAVGADK